MNYLVPLAYVAVGMFLGGSLSWLLIRTKAQEAFKREKIAIDKLQKFSDALQKTPPSMDEKQKARFDALETMRAAHWTSFDRRREFEWKFNLAIWTALASFIAVGLTRHEPLPLTPVNIISASLGGLIILLVHGHFLYGLSRANRIDRQQAYFINDTWMEPMMGIIMPEHINRKKQNRSKFMGTIWNWAFTTEFLLTVLLCILAMLVIFR